MQKIRYIIGSIIFSIILPIWTALLSAAISIISYINKEKAYTTANMLGKGALKILAYLSGLKVKYENVPKNFNGNIIVSQHQSAMEILALIAIIPKPIFVLKKSLMHVPIFGRALKVLGMIPVDRKNFNASWMKLAKAELENGKNLIIFPEGTRTKIGQEIPYRAGAFKLAQVLDKKIIPVAVNTGLFWPRRAWIKKSGVASIVFGKPMVVENIEDSMKKLRKEYKKLI